MEFDFNNHIIGEFYLGGTKVLFTETMRNSLIVSIILIVFAICVRIAFKKFEDIPKGFQNAIETLVEMFYNLAKDCLGEKYSFFGNWYFTVLLYVLTCNYVGMLGLRSPTADLATTLSLSLITFSLIHITGISLKKFDYFKGYLDPVPVFLPMNILGALATPISLSFRLFGNILGGTIIMTMLYAAFPAVLKAFAPAPFHLYFDIFGGALQAVIFTMLGMLFISEQLPEN